MSDDPLLRVRQACMRLTQKTNGESVKVLLKAGSADAMAEHAVSFGRKRKMGVRVERQADSLLLVRDDGLLASKYAVVDDLEVGASHVFEVDSTQHLAVRTNVSQRGRVQGKRFSCNVVPEGLKVTRIALDAPVTRGRPRVAGSALAWDLGPLERLLWIDLEPTPHQVSAVRHAINRAQIQHGWLLTTRFVGGRMRVYRLDHPAEGPAPQAQAA